jgi:hypothetical protein
MNVPLQSYDMHRRFREELWTAEKVAENMAKHHAQLHKQRLKAEEQKRQSEKVQTAAISAVTAVVSKATSEQSQQAVNPGSSAKEQASTPTSSATFSTSAVKGPSEVKAKGFTSEEKDSSQATTSQKPTLPPPPPAPIDRRFASDKVVRPPWYRRLYNYTPPPTGWTSDETYGHRTYIIPHPIHTAKENLMRSWALVLIPTWKVTKALGTSFTSGSQRRFWGEMWKFSRDGGHAGLVAQIRTGWQKKVLEETERMEKEKKERGEGSSSGANGGSSASSS